MQKYVHLVDLVKNWLSNESLLAKFGVDTAENEPLEVWWKIIQYYSFVSLGPGGAAGRSRRFGGEVCDVGLLEELQGAYVSERAPRVLVFIPARAFLGRSPLEGD